MLVRPRIHLWATGLGWLKPARVLRMGGWVALRGHGVQVGLEWVAVAGGHWSSPVHGALLYSPQIDLGAGAAGRCGSARR